MIYLVQYMMLAFGFLFMIFGAASPPLYGAIFMFFGLVIAACGPIMLHLRTIKLGLHHLIEPPARGVVNWLYIRKSGDIEILPSFKRIEGMLESEEIGAMIHEYKTYRLCDQSIRLVAEGHGHAADVGLCLYASYLKRNGIKSLLQARDNDIPKEYIKEKLEEEKNEKKDSRNIRQAEIIEPVKTTIQSNTHGRSKNGKRKPYLTRKA